MKKIFLTFLYIYYQTKNDLLFNILGYGGKATLSNKIEMNDIYKSTDGIKWKRVGNSTTSLNRWSRRSAFGIATMNENVYVIGMYI